MNITSFELCKVTPTDAINGSPLSRIMQPFGEYVMPESAVVALAEEGLKKEAGYFECITSATIDTEKKCLKNGDDVFTQKFKELLKQKTWKFQDLNGKRVLLCGAYSIGDQLWYTHTLHLLKQKYPDAKIYTLTYMGYGDGLWAGNPEVNELQMPVTAAAFESFDYYIPLLSIVASNVNMAESSRQGKIVHSTRTPYEDFADLLGLYPIDLNEAKPRLYPTQDDWVLFCRKITDKHFRHLVQGTQVISPVNYIVVQMHTQKESRDFTHEQLLDITRALRREYSNTLIFMVGEDLAGVSTKGSDAYRYIISEMRNDTIPPIPIVSTATFRYTFRELAAMVNNAMLVVTPDSMVSHLAAAFDVPLVSCYGSYSAKWRAVTYKYCESIELQGICPIAPCAYPGAGFPKDCPTQEQNHCGVMAGITGEMVVEAARKAIGKKRVDMPEWGKETKPEKIKLPKNPRKSKMRLLK